LPEQLIMLHLQKAASSARQSIGLARTAQPQRMTGPPIATGVEVFSVAPPKPV